MYKILIKLVDDALLPAALITFTKIIGVFIAGRILDIPSSFSSLFNPASVLLAGVSQSQLIAENSFSDFLMYSAVFAGCIIIVIKTLFFHQTHLNPKLVLHLAHTNLLDIVEASFEIYSLAIIWFLFLYIITIYIAIEGFIGDVSVQLSIVLVALSLVLGWVLIKDIESEINSSMKKPKIKKAKIL